jgi:hypothetical protein
MNSFEVECDDKVVRVCLDFDCGFVASSFAKAIGLFLKALSQIPRELPEGMCL